MALLHVQRDTVPRVGRAKLDHGNGLALLFSGRLDQRAELTAEFGLGDSETLDDEELVAAAWRRFGPDFARHLVGDFALCLHDAASGRLVLGRDHCGVMPLYHARIGPLVAVANCIEFLRIVPGIDPNWDDAWLADTLALAKREAAQTPYRAIRAVPPAHTLVIDSMGERSERYWSLPMYPSVLDIGEEEATEEFLRLFDQAVACRLRSLDAVASELSAGLDSTAIATSSARHLAGTGRTLHTLTHALPEGMACADGLRDDRADLAPLLAQYPSLNHHWIVSETDCFIGVLRRTLARHGAPPRNDLNAIGEELPATLRAHDIRVLLSGFGGDQLVTSHGGGYLESLLDERDFASLRALTATRHGPLGAALRMLFYRSSIGRMGLAQREAARVRAQSSDLAGLGTPNFLAGHGLTERQQDRPHAGNMRRREAGLIARPHIAYRVQDSAIGAFANGFAYRYPMLDIRLMEFTHNLPARLKRAPGLDRCMIRRAMAGRVPDSIRLRTDQGGATIPSAQRNFTLHAGELATLIERHRNDPRLAGKVQFGPAIETLRQTQARGDFGGPMVKKQVLLLALLCLWAERDGAD